MRQSPGIELLERNHIIDLLLMIYARDIKGETTRLIDVVYTSNHTRYNRIHELEDLGLVEIDAPGRKHNEKFLSLTPYGMTVAVLLQRAVETIDRHMGGEQ